MSVCTNSEIYTLDGSSQKITPNQNSTRSRDPTLEALRNRKIKMPHITKRLNTVEKYIREFTNQTIERSKEKSLKHQLSYSTIQIEDELDVDCVRFKKHSKTIFISELAPVTETHCNKKNQDNYKDIGSKDSVSRF